MNVLAPLFLAGLALVIGPILFHLLRQTPKNRVTFSSTELLDASPPKAKQKRRLQNPWLLLIRCLIIALLCLAFARPFLTSPEDLPLGDLAPRDVVIAIDESASMGRDGLWTQALQELRTIGESLHEFDRLSLILFSDTAETVIDSQLWSSVPFDERVELLEKRFAQRSPQPRIGKLDLAVERSIQELEAIRETQQTHGFGEIIVISDFAQGSELSGLAGVEWPNNSTLRRIPVQLEVASSNIGIRWLGWTESDTDSAHARFGLVHDRADLATEITLDIVDVATGVTLLDTQTLFLEGKSEQLASFELPKSAMGSPLRVTIRGDNSPFDNTLFIAPEHVNRVDLALFTEHELSDAAQAPYFIDKALAGFESPIVNLKLNPESASLETNAMIIDGTLSKEQAESARRRIQDGAHALLLLSEEAQLDSLTALTDTHGWQIEPSDRAHLLVGSIDFAHPLFQPFSDPRFNNFTNIRFWNASRLQYPQNGATRQLAAFDSGDPLLLEIGIGKGRLFVWTASWRLSESQWTLSSKFVPWLHRFVLEAAGGRPQPSNPTFNAVNVERYANLGFEKQADSERLYTLNTNGQTRWVAFHLPADESKVTPISEDAWDRMGLPDFSAEEQAESAERFAAELRSENAVETEQRQKLWQWILFTALILLALESVLAIKIGNRREAAFS